MPKSTANNKRAEKNKKVLAAILTKQFSSSALLRKFSLTPAQLYRYRAILRDEKKLKAMVSGTPMGSPRKVTDAHVMSIRAIFDGNLG